MVGVGMEAAGGAMITTPKVAVEDMKEEAEEDMETGEVEEEAAEGGRCREAGEKVLEEGEAVTARATIKMPEVIKGEEGEVATEEEGTTKEAFRILATMEEEEEEEEEEVVVEVVTMTITNKMEAGIRREEGVEEVVGAGEEEAEEEKEAEEKEAEEEKDEEEEKEDEEEEKEAEEEDGEAEGGRILTKEDSLNSSSNMAGSTTAKLALIKADTTLVEHTVRGIAAESTQRWTLYHM
ncbi:hypothetical protein VZT92_001985 [Zoarces viviparus]|uniref:Uncharacterized protein n=1 Tax=Zoarces viviparus TaxID=48416 RepID=A0AAW1G4K4_ZOAVI